MEDYFQLSDGPFSVCAEYIFITIASAWICKTVIAILAATRWACNDNLQDFGRSDDRYWKATKNSLKVVIEQSSEMRQFYSVSRLATENTS